MSSLLVGGMETFVVQLAQEQRERGYSAGVLALRGGPLSGTAAQRNVPVTALDARSVVTRLARATMVFARVRPGVIHAHNPTSLHYAVLGKRLTGARVVLTYHGRGAADGRQPSAAEWSRADAVVAVSQAAALQLDGRTSGARVQVIPNGVSAPQAARSRAAVRAELGLGEDVVGIMVARIDGMKGHDVLVRAMAMLGKRSAGLRILVVGDGADRAAIEAQARTLDANGTRFRFLGFRGDVPDLLSASDFFLLPSLAEGLPLSLLEAMAQRLPIVASAVGGVPEAVQDGVHGLLVPAQDPAALAAAVTRLASDPELRNRLGVAAFERARVDFSFRRMADRYEELYRSLQ